MTPLPKQKIQNNVFNMLIKGIFTVWKQTKS